MKIPQNYITGYENKNIGGGMLTNGPIYQKNYTKRKSVSLIHKKLCQTQELYARKMLAKQFLLKLPNLKVPTGTTLHCLKY